jgi:ABC-type lipoprotein release transport system permease subunit
LEEGGEALSILSLQGSMYVGGRLHPVVLKGIDPGQKILRFPSSQLMSADGDVPALVGGRMAKSANITVGDIVTLQWRDVTGTFDARDVRIAQVFSTSVQSVDNNQIWLPLDTLRQFAGMEGQATLMIVAPGLFHPPQDTGWRFKSQDDLLSDIREVVRSKTVGSSVIYVILLLLALLAIFDTQVLSVWRRRKEIGTLMALGMTRGKVIRLFTLEGAMHGVLAALVACAYGIPLLGMLARGGWELPTITESYGFAIGERLFPVFSAGLVAGTTIFVLIVTTIVSYMPTRRIAKLKPTDALRGKFT